MNKIFFDNWDSLLRILILAVLSYVLLIVMLRVSGKRTLSKMNAFDFVITVALGSTLSSIIISKDTTLSGGVLALALLIFLQFVITKLSVNFKAISNLVKADPRLLFYHGRFLRDAMQDERVTEDELRSVIRKEGLESLDQVDAIIMETSGEFTVLYRTATPHTEEPPVLKHVKR
ncbi:DUF421 domain-containing protein [Nibrella viscosa]|uniref:DUF421 domain-containing protein n=1 Tax=Nibrella viscosa TaxID=1084524 RepID=A0ABP8KJ84_9BACT